MSVQLLPVNQNTGRRSQKFASYLFRAHVPEILCWENKTQVLCFWKITHNVHIFMCGNSSNGSGSALMLLRFRAADSTPAGGSDLVAWHLFVNVLSFTICVTRYFVGIAPSFVDQNHLRYLLCLAPRSLFYIPFKFSRLLSLFFHCKQNKSRRGIYCMSTSCNPCLFTSLPPQVLCSLIKGAGLQRRTEQVLEFGSALEATAAQSLNTQA